MAQVFERRGMWYARFQHEGKDYLRSTGIPHLKGRGRAAAKTKKDAEEELSRMLAEIRGRESVDALFNRLTDAIEKLPESEQEPRRLTLAHRLRENVSSKLAVADAWQEWLESPRKRLPSEATVEMYHAYWGRDKIKKHGNKKNQGGFTNWLKKHHPEITHLHEITEAVAMEYAKYLRKTGIAPRTYNGAIKFLRSMFKTLTLQAGLVSNVWSGIEYEDNSTESRRALSEDEIANIIKKARGKVRCWLILGYYTSLRLGDVLTLKWNEIDLAKKTIIRIPRKTSRSKKPSIIPLHPEVLKALKALERKRKEGDEYLFPEDAAKYLKGQSSAITKKIQQHFTDCDIQTTEEASGNRKKAIVRVGFHSLRHGFVSLLEAHNVSRSVVQDLVGHSSPAMTAHYSHATLQQKIDAIESLPEITRGKKKRKA